MDEEQSSSELSHGSEARPNTPFGEPSDEPENTMENNVEYTGIIEDPSWIDEENSGMGEHIVRKNPQLSHKCSRTKRKTLANLSSLTEEPRSSENESRGQKMNKKNKWPKKLKKSKENDQNTLMTSNSTKNAVALPKIDTYCISYVRPSTNHGFAYAVSANELLNGKNRIFSKLSREHRTTQLDSTSQHGFPQKGNMYLLFRAPSRACGLSIPALTVRARPKEMNELKDSKENKNDKTTVKTNIVKFPDINEDMWK